MGWMEWVEGLYGGVRRDGGGVFGSLGKARWDAVEEKEQAWIVKRETLRGSSFTGRSPNRIGAYNI